MTARLFFAFTLLLALLCACVPTIYGVPRPTWETMGEAERIEAMRIYEERARARQQAAEEQARRAALERERLAAQQEADAQRTRERIAAIHRGEGAWGELLRVRLQGGEVRSGKDFVHFRPVTFELAEDEIREIALVDEQQHRGRMLRVAYRGGAVILDSPVQGKGGAVFLPYDRRWDDGVLYPDLDSSGPLQLRGADVVVEIVGRASRNDRDRPGSVIRIEQQYRHRRDDQPPPPPVVSNRDQPQPERPGDDRRDKPPRVEQPPVMNERREPQANPVAGRDEQAEDRRQEHASQRPATEKSREKQLVETPLPNHKEIAQTPQRVDLRLVGGTIQGRGKPAPVEPFALQLSDGETQQLVVRAGEERATVSVSYRQGEVVIAGSPAGRGRNDSVRLRLNPGRESKQRYPIEALGPLRLKNGELTITAVN